jgi:hypothetical protein
MNPGILAADYLSSLFKDNEKYKGSRVHFWPWPDSWKVLTGFRWMCLATSINAHNLFIAFMTFFLILKIWVG